MRSTLAAMLVLALFAELGPQSADASGLGKIGSMGPTTECRDNRPHPYPKQTLNRLSLGIGAGGAGQDSPDLDFVGLRLKAGRKLLYRVDKCVTKTILSSQGWVTGVTPQLIGSLSFSDVADRSRLGVAVQIGREGPWGMAYFLEPGASYGQAGLGVSVEAGATVLLPGAAFKYEYFTRNDRHGVFIFFDLSNLQLVPRLLR